MKGGEIYSHLWAVNFVKRIEKRRCTVTSLFISNRSYGVFVKNVIAPGQYPVFIRGKLKAKLFGKISQILTAALGQNLADNEEYNNK